MQFWPWQSQSDKQTSKSTPSLAHRLWWKADSGFGYCDGRSPCSCEIGDNPRQHVADTALLGTRDARWLSTVWGILEPDELAQLSDARQFETALLEASHEKLLPALERALLPQVRAVRFSDRRTRFDFVPAPDGDELPLGLVLVRVLYSNESLASHLHLYARPAFVLAVAIDVDTRVARLKAVVESDNAFRTFRDALEATMVRFDTTRQRLEHLLHQPGAVDFSRIDDLPAVEAIFQLQPGLRRIYQSRCGEDPLTLLARINVETAVEGRHVEGEVELLGKV